MIGKALGTAAGKFAAGAFLALAIALGVVMWRADAISAERETLRNKLAGEEARHAFTRASLDTLTLELQRFVAQGRLREKAVEEAMERMAEETAPLKAEAERIEREGMSPDYPDRLRKAGL